MSKTEITFSEYANKFYCIIEGGKGNKAKFVKSLLKIGLIESRKKIIDELFPTETNSKGNTIITPRKADQLRKYLRGENGITDIADEIYAALDHENFDSYVNELKDYEDEKVIEFAMSLRLDTDLNSINEVRQAIAACYYSIIEKASSHKLPFHKKTKDVVFSYSFTEAEKKAFAQLCNLIMEHLKDLQRQTIKISDYQHEIKSLTDPRADNNWKTYLEKEIKLSLNDFDNTYTKIEILCSDLAELVKPKKDMDAVLRKILSFAQNISKDEYKSIRSKRYDYQALWHMISQLNENIEKLLRFTDEL